MQQWGTAFSKGCGCLLLGSCRLMDVWAWEAWHIHQASAEYGVTRLLTLTLPFSLCCYLPGFTIAYNQIPGGWRWMNRIVPVTWVIYALSASQLGSVTVPMTGYGVTEGTPVYQYLQDVFGYHYDFKWYALLIAASYVVFFTLASIWYMRHVNFLRR
jgi:hypothetical protein